MNKEIFTTKKDINKIKIGILADIHIYNGFNYKILDKCEKQINEEHPNYLVIAGDILDRSNYNYQGLLEFLKRIAKNTTIIMVLGNHDTYKRITKNKITEEINTNFIEDIKKEKNIYLLDDTTFIHDNICFYGITLSFNHYYKNREKYNDFLNEISTLKTKLSPNNYNILLIHSPINIYRYIERNPESNLAKTDLIISGHMHNGCIPYTITNPFNKLFKNNRSLISPHIIYEGLVKLSNSSGLFQYLDFIYHRKVKFIEIKKEID